MHHYTALPSLLATRKGIYWRQKKPTTIWKAFPIGDVNLVFLGWGDAELKLAKCSSKANSATWLHTELGPKNWTTGQGV